MPNPFDKFGVSDSELAKHIRSSAEVDAGINEFMENEGVPYGKSVSPVETGKYAASWKVMTKAKNGRGVFGPTAWYSHLVEFGTGSDKKQGTKQGKKKRGKSDKRPVEMDDGQFRAVGPNTPTKPLGVAQKVASHFGGSLESSGIEVGDD